MDQALRARWRSLEAMADGLRGVRRWMLDRRERPFGETHASPTSVVCLAGAIHVTRRREQVELRAGEALLIAPGVGHEHQPVRPGGVYLRQGFITGASDVMLGDADGWWHGTLVRQPSRRLIEAALAASQEARRVVLVAELLREVLTRQVEDLGLFTHPALSRMTGTLWNGIASGANVNDIVAASGLSRAQAHRVFTAGFGVCARQALAETRLRLAESLLAAGLPVAEVAERTGYSSPGIFARAWKRARGRSPRAMRTELRVRSDQ